jgi:hypothetical protein
MRFEAADFSRLTVVAVMIAALLLPSAAWHGLARAEPANEAGAGESGEPDLSAAKTAATELIRVTGATARFARQQLREMPRDGFDPAAAAAIHAATPADGLAFVREQTAWLPYHGSLRGRPAS